MTKKDVICFDDSNSHDEYFSLCLDSWESLPFTIDINLRISIGASRAGENIRIFIQKDIKTLTDELIDAGYSEEAIESFLISEKEPKITDSMISFNRRIWSELRRVRGDQLGLPLEVNKNGTLHIGERADEDTMYIFGRRKK